MSWCVSENLKLFVIFFGTTIPSGTEPSHCRGFTISVRHITLGRNPPEEWSDRHRDLYLTTQHS